jgi:hypothetical protein
MKILDVAASPSWMMNGGPNINVLRQAFGVDFWSMQIDFPSDCQRIPNFCDALLPYSENRPFKGATLWIRNWGIWNDHAERAGMYILQALRHSVGETRPLLEYPGHLFDSSEVIDAQSYLMLPILFGWDALLVSSEEKYVLSISHDEYIDVYGGVDYSREEMAKSISSYIPKKD